MKISNKTKYGFQFMLSLAVDYGNKYLNIRDIAQKEDIPIKFLENIVSIIKPAEIVQVKRGANGGYRLAKSPDKINLLQIFEILEGQVLPSEKNPKEIKSEIDDIVDSVWKDMHFMLVSYLTENTLADLVKKYIDKQKNLMFYI